MSRQQVTTLDILDGTVATVDLANGAVTNAKAASDVARANLLTNGGFEIWQRGNGPFTNAGGGARSADRWTILGATNLVSVSRDTANADTGSTYCAAVTAAAGITSGNVGDFSQRLTDMTEAKGRILSASVRIKTTTANAVKLRLSGDAGTSYADSSWHPGTGAYVTLTATLPVASTTDAWVRIWFEAPCTAYIDNAMLVVGSVAADYVPLHPADDLARCLRYYETFGIDNSWIISGYNIAGGLQYFTSPYKARKPVTPTVTRVGTWSLLNCSTPSSDVAGTEAFRSNTTITANGTFYASAGASNYWTVEANP